MNDTVYVYKIGIDGPKCLLRLIRLIDKKWILGSYLLNSLKENNLDWDDLNY